MVRTRGSVNEGEIADDSNVTNTETPTDPLAAIVAKLSIIDDLRDKIAALEVQNRNQSAKKKKLNLDDLDDETEYVPRRYNRLPHAKIEFPKFSGGDPRGWILKAEKYFRYYETPEDDRVDIAAMNLEGDALDLFSWVISERTLLYWDELVRIFQEHYGPPEFQNPDEHLSSIQQTDSVQEYRLEWARRVARVKNWPDHCLLGVFMNGLKEELKSEVRLHKPKTVYRAISLAVEMEKKLQLKESKPDTSFSAQSNQAHYSHLAQYNSAHIPAQTVFSAHSNGTAHSNSASAQLPSITHSIQSAASSSPSPYAAATVRDSSYATRQQRRDKGLCFRCGDPLRPGHHCVLASLSLMDVDATGNSMWEEIGGLPQIEKVTGNLSLEKKDRLLQIDGVT